MEVRARTEHDVEPALALLGLVHDADGYPSTMDAIDAFLVPPYEVGAWVAVAEERVVGHVALHRPPGSATAAVASRATGLRPEQHLLLSRLFVSPDRRGQGLGRRLLNVARAEAERRGERAVLDVGKDFPSAAALYESAGWLRVAEDRQVFGPGGFEVWSTSPRATPGKCRRPRRRSRHYRWRRGLSLCGMEGAGSGGEPVKVMEVVSLTREFALDICTWRYPPPYGCYDMTDVDPDQLVQPQSGFFALVRGGDLIGFRSFGSDGRVPGWEYDEAALDTGGGLRPELTGRGLGREAIATGLAFGRVRFAPAAFRVTVAAFNTRALRTVTALGFNLVGSFDASTNGAPFEVLVRSER